MTGTSREPGRHTVPLPRSNPRGKQGRGCPSQSSPWTLKSRDTRTSQGPTERCTEAPTDPNHRRPSTQGTPGARPTRSTLFNETRQPRRRKPEPSFNKNQSPDSSQTGPLPSVPGPYGRPRPTAPGPSVVPCLTLYRGSSPASPSRGSRRAGRRPLQTPFLSLSSRQRRAPTQCTDNSKAFVTKHVSRLGPGRARRSVVAHAESKRSTDLESRKKKSLSRSKESPGPQSPVPSPSADHTGELPSTRSL